MSRNRQNPLIAALVVLTITAATKADYRDNSKAIKVSGGEDHTLVVTANNQAWVCGPNGGYAFGYHYYGVLGTGSEYWNLQQKTLVRVHDGAMGTESQRLENINDIAAGWMHSLALDVNGFVWSWGWNSEGELGDPQVDYATTPVRVLRGEQVPENPIDPDPNLARIIAISAGRSGQHSLAVDADAYAYGWGYNKYGQCGNDESNNRKLTAVQVHRGEQPQDPNDPNDWLKHIVDICAGADQSIALEKDDPGDPNFNGCVYTWGTNWWGDEDYEWIEAGYGLLGTASMADFSDTPVKVLAGAQHANDPNQHLKHIVAVAAGWDHCMALEKDDPYDPNIYNPAYTGRVFTWGNNGQGWGGGSPVGWERSVGGRLGNGTYTDSNVPVLVLSGEQHPNDPNQPYLNHIAAVSAGEGHSMALDANGYVYCWGDNQYGQLGNGRNEPCSAPVRVIAGMQNSEDPNSPLSNIVAISSGHWHSLAVDSDGVVWVWGKTKDGRLGLADMAYANPYVCGVPHRIPVVYDYNDAGVGKGFAFSIEDAINDANEGDVLEASCGIYYENVIFGDESITLRSEAPEEPEVVGDTIIDAVYNSGSDYPLSPAVDFNDASGSILAGFTLVDACSVGVLCEDVNSVTVMSCLIRDNARHGIWLNASSVDIQNCEISGKASDETSDYHGVYCESESDVNIVNCTIADNDGNGINCNQSSAAITDSAIHDNADYGLEATGDCNVTIQRSLIEGNGKSGVYAHDGGDFVLNGSVVRDNGWDGVDLEDNTSETLTNNWIHNNGTAGESYGCGIWFENYQSATPFVRNNTICGNPTYGIEVGDANYTDPNIINCIIFANDSNDLYRNNGDFESVNYCSLQNAWGGTGNIVVDPCFIDADANDFHVDGNSLCIDAGDPDFTGDANETDIDGNPRVMGGRVDMGADEDFPHCDPNYPDWVSFGRPNCWMWPYQCDGDADGINSGVPFYYRVYTGDMALIIQNWRKKMGAPGLNPCADIDHINSGAPNYYRVYTGDVAKVIANWRKKPGTPPSGLAGDCANRCSQRGALGGGSPGTQLTSRELLDRLAEIWLDPEVRKSIDEEKFLKVYESLKELESSRDLFR